MASSGNFCTLSPIAELGTSTGASTRAGSMSQGNLKYVNLSNETAVGTFGVTSGKWYYEVYINSFNADNGMAIGWVNDLFNLNAELGYNSPSSPSGGQAFALYAQDQKLIYGPGDGGSSYNKTYGSGTPTDGDIVRIWLDADNGKFWAGLNGTIYGSGDPSAGTGHGFGTGGSPHNVAISTRTLYPAIGNWSAADATVTFNFGQDSTFQGAVTSGTHVDGNGFGDFKYDPDGFLALCTANLPADADIDPAETDVNPPVKNFGAVTYTGNAGTNAISGVGFQPDLVWIKISNTASNGPLVDSSRGANKPIFSQVTNAEVTSADISSFDSDGFTLTGTGDYDANFNGNTNSYVAWCWKANGGTTSTNTSGTITSTVQANTAGGFSIVQYTGTGTNSTVGHGLSAAPEYMIIKNLDTTDNWINYNKVGGAANRGQLNSGSYGTSTTSFQSTDPSATVITLGTSSGVNKSTSNMIAYVWHGVEGFSKFGDYTGNGNADGPMIYTGFRPRLVSMIRSTGGSYNVFDSARYPNNPNDAYLQWTAHDAQTTGYPIDFLANGFKIRTTGTGLNQSGTNFYYACWGDVPFKYNNAF